jgi:hypothetical protein
MLKNQKACPELASGSLPFRTSPKQGDNLNTHLVRYKMFMLSFVNHKQVQE